MTTQCQLAGCEQSSKPLSNFCHFHTSEFQRLGLLALDYDTGTHGSSIENVVTTYDHLKINIEQTAKGARVTVTYDRSDHDIIAAVQSAVLTYEDTIKLLKENGNKVDES